MIRTDSRKIRPGDTFVALDGFSSNGSQYIESAIRNGAVKVICKEGSYEVETVNTPDTRKYLEDLLEEEYGEIVSGMTLIGVTGTNGKTTTCYLVSQLLNALGLPCAYIGTIGFYMGEKVKELPNTSVDIADLYELLLYAHENGFDHVALEASSQGLDMGRLHTIRFDAAGFTNLTEDHLDYHKNMENYAVAKQILFKSLKPGAAAVINYDDEAKKYFALEGNNNITYGFNGGDFKVVSYGFDGCSVINYEADGEVYEVRTKLVGNYNIANLLCCIALVNSLGPELDDINEAVYELEAPDGRCERVVYKDNSIVIDYAHTPDAIDNIIASARGFTKNNIYVVFGCTGDREREKRPVMTEKVLSQCKKAIITVDDIHFEDVDRIFDDMLEGNTYDNYEIIRDRREAIRAGIDLLEDGDSLLVLGKGHEKFIIVGNDKVPHNDKQAVLELIKER